MTRILVQTVEGNTGIYVIEMNFWQGVVFYAAALTLLMTLILVIVALKRR